MNRAIILLALSVSMIMATLPVQASRDDACVDVLAVRDDDSHSGWGVGIYGRPGLGSKDAHAVPVKTIDDVASITSEDNLPPMWGFVQEHFAYIVGYPDGEIRPNGNMTRAEVATVFYRLVNDVVRDVYFTQVNQFSDVQGGQWFNNAISLMSSLGILQGYEDSTFKPNVAITRAEMATICARFARAFDTRRYFGVVSFSDIDGHWAEDDIKYAAATGWVRGYEDGTFRPDAGITRAEVMALFNRLLKRAPETVDDLLVDEMITWSDNSDPDAWYYLDVQETTNSHYPDFKDKLVEGTDYYYEFWFEMVDNRDWTELER